MYQIQNQIQILSHLENFETLTYNAKKEFSNGWLMGEMSSEKFEEKNFPILDLPYNIRICSKRAHTNSLPPLTVSDF